MRELTEAENDAPQDAPLCRGCHKPVTEQQGFYCDDCYAKVYPSTFNYDDD